MAAALELCAIALVFAFLGSMPLAGPIAVLTLSRAASGRFGEALRIGLGAAVAEGVYAALAFWGFATFLPRHAWVGIASRGATGLLLVALGVRFVFWRPPADAPSRETKAGTAFLGFSISALNPTLLATWTAVVAFLYAHGMEPRPAILAIPFGACAAVGVGSWFACLVAILRKLESKLPVTALRWMIRTMGIALVIMGVVTCVRFVREIT